MTIDGKVSGASLVRPGVGKIKRGRTVSGMASLVATSVAFAGLALVALALALLARAYSKTALAAGLLGLLGLTRSEERRVGKEC